MEQVSINKLLAPPVVHVGVILFSSLYLVH